MSWKISLLSINELAWVNVKYILPELLIKKAFFWAEIWAFVAAEKPGAVCVKNKKKQASKRWIQVSRLMQQI